MIVGYRITPLLYGEVHGYLEVITQVLSRLVLYIYIDSYIVANRIGGVMASVFASSAGDCQFKPRLGQTKNYKVDICYFSTQH
jgi:hypothetical protein